MNMNNKKKAFTLSEVLITLSLIGVLAAMSIPTIGYNVHKRAQLSEFKTAYSIISSTYESLNITNGSVYPCYTVADERKRMEEGYDHTLRSQVPIETRGCKKFEVDYMRALGVSHKCEKDIYTEGCIPKRYAKLNDFSNYEKAYLLKNGMIIIPSTNGMILFALDINGRKGPNQWGKDIFAFSPMVTSSEISASTGKPIVTKVELLAADEDRVAPYFQGGKDVKTTTEMIYEAVGRTFK